MKKLPRIARFTASREISATIPLGMVAAVLNTGFCGFVARKALHMQNGTLSVLLASQFVAFLITSPIIGQFNHVRKIKFLVTALLALSASLISIAFTAKPTTDPALLSQPNVYHILFIIQIFIAQLGMGLIVTLRTSLWRANYPSHMRARFVVVINLCGLIVTSAAALLFSTLMDQTTFDFRVVYLISGITGIIAAILFNRIRIRRENSTLNLVKQFASAKTKIFAGLTVLLHDHRFRYFMSWQMLNGLATLMIEVVLIVLLNDVYESSWIIGGSALTAIPLLISAISALFWSKLFDTRNIFQMRTYGAFIWGISRTMLGIAILLFVWGMPTISIVILLASRFVSGIAMGCGQLAWQLGHMEFAPPHQDSLYMSAHISLAGIRGIIAAFLGLYLYKLPCLGPHAIILIFISAACLFTASIAFHLMPRRIGQNHQPNSAL